MAEASNLERISRIYTGLGNSGGLFWYGEFTFTLNEKGGTRDLQSQEDQKITFSFTGKKFSLEKKSMIRRPGLSKHNKKIQKTEVVDCGVRNEHPKMQPQNMSQMDKNWRERDR